MSNMLKVKLIPKFLFVSELTFETLDNAVPVVEAFTAGNTVRQRAGSSAIASITLFASDSLHTRTLSSKWVALKGH